MEFQRLREHATLLQTLNGSEGDLDGFFCVQKYLQVLTNYLIKNCRSVVTVSEYSRDDVIDRLGVSSDNINLEEFERDLLVLKGGTTVGTLKLIGGEPTLHPQILEFMAKAREIAIAKRLAVITNGTVLHRMPEAFWSYLDYLQVTFYPGIDMPMPRDEIRAKAKHYEFKLDIVDHGLFRHTVVDRKIEEPELVRQIYEACELPTIHACHTVRHGHLFKCSPAAFTADRLGKLNIAFQDAQDCVPLHDNTDLVSEIEKYMANTNPLPSCDYCLGTSGSDFTHHQLLPWFVKLTSSASDTPDETEPRTLIDPTRLKPINRQDSGGHDGPQSP